jgi:hypothetical protein
VSGRYVERRGWETRVFRSPEGRRAIRALANNYKDEVVVSVPVKDGDLQDQYSASGRVRSGHLSFGTPTMEYWTGVYIWHIIEYGSVNNPPYAVLRRAAESAGLHFEGK